MNPRYAILIDGGFATKAIGRRTKKAADSAAIISECERIKNSPVLANQDLLRIYYYDAPPASGKLTDPLSRTELDLSANDVHKRGAALLQQIELSQDFAVRRGETVVRGWKIGDKAFKNLVQSPRPLAAGDLVPNIQQKGVDLRIGLDIALLALRQLVQTIVVVTGDSDLIPAFKLARREGLRVYLEHLGMPVRTEFKAHADIILPP